MQIHILELLIAGALSVYLIWITPMRKARLLEKFLGFLLMWAIFYVAVLAMSGGHPYEPQ